MIVNLCNFIITTVKSQDTSPTITIVAFGTSQITLADCSYLNPKENDTLLNAAFDKALSYQPEIVWVLTDNIQDDRSSPAGNTAEFYRKLENDIVTRVVVFPFVAPPGVSGLIAYALLLSPGQGSLFEKELNFFTQNASAKYKTEALRMKPLDKKTIIVVRDGKKQGDENSVARKSQIYQEGVPIKERVKFQLQSRFDHLNVTDAPIVCPPEAKFLGKDASPLILPGRQAKITPERVEKLDASGKSADFEITVTANPIRLKKDFQSLMTMAFSGTQEAVTLDIPCVIRVPRQSFGFKNAFVERYGADKPEEAKKSGKIHGIRNLPTHLAAPQTEIPIPVPIEIAVAYPLWPAVLLLGGALVGLVILGSGIWATQNYVPALIKGKARWAVKAETSNGQYLPSELEKGGSVLVQGEKVGEVRSDEFTVGSGFEGERGQTHFPLREETLVKVQKGRVVTVLKFSPQAVTNGSKKTEEGRPGRR